MKKYTGVGVGTMVMTRRGEIPIASVKVGDLVLTHKDRWKPITQSTITQGISMIRMIGDGRKWLIITPETLIYASDGEFVEPKWIPALQGKGVYWAIPQGFDYCGPSTNIHYGQSGFDFSPIRSVEPFGIGEICTILIQDDESYVADGIVIRN